MSDLRRWLRRSVSVAAIGLAYSMAANGQTQPTDAHVVGTVTDSSGGSISGAMVFGRTALHGQEFEAKTDAYGNFETHGIEPGRYVIEVQRESFERWSEEIEVRAGEPTTLAVVMEIAELVQEVTIAESNRSVSTEPSGNIDAIVLDEEMLNDLPTQQGSIQEMLQGLFGVDAIGDVIIDGQPGSLEDLPASAIKSIRINRNPYSAEYFSPGAGRVEITTRSGASKFHGSFGSTFSDYRLDARNAFAQERPAEQGRYYSGYLTGPVAAGDKVTFSVSASRSEQDAESIVYASTPVGVVSTNVPNPRRSDNVTASVGARFDENQRLSIRYGFRRYSDRNAGVGGVVLPESAFDSVGDGHSIRASYENTLSPNWLSQSFVEARSVSWSAASLLRGEPMIVVTDAFTAGGAQADYLSDGLSLQFGQTFSRAKGKNTLRFGINGPSLYRSGSQDLSNRNGTFYFSSNADYVARQAFTFTQQRGAPGLNYWSQHFGVYVQNDYNVRSNLTVALGVRYDWQNYVDDRNNVLPRVSLAYAPGQQRNMVLRLGAGIFSARLDRSSIGETLRYDGAGIHEVVVNDPDFDDPLGGESIFELPQSLVIPAADWRSPQIIQYSGSVERNLWKDTTLSVSYLNSRVLHNFRSRDVNSPMAPGYEDRPNLGFAVIRQIESSARRVRHQLRLGVRGQFSPFLSGLVRYTYRRTFDDASGVESFPANSYDLSGEWGRASSDRRHGLYFYGSLKVKQLFTIGIIANVLSATPYTVTTGLDTNRDGRPLERPIGIPRNSLAGFGYRTLDLRWSRKFSLAPKRWEQMRITVGADMFNVLNNVNYGRVVGNLSSPFYGSPISASRARRIVIYGKFSF